MFVLDRNCQDVEHAVIAESVGHLLNRRCGIEPIIGVVIPDGLFNGRLAGDAQVSG